MPFSEIRKHMLRSGTSLGTDADSYPKAHEHLAIVFFDILLLDDEIIMSRPVEDRRECLRKTYRKIGGHAMSAEWKTVDFSIVHASKNILMQQFAASIAQRCEGLLLKPCGVPYLSLEANPKSYNNSYIKLKKDYSDGMGDEADFAIIGGSYNAVQAAKSGVPGIKWTDFHLGCLLNKDEVMRFDARPRFKVVGTIQQEHCIPTAILGAANGLGTFCAIDYKVELKAANLDIVNTEPVVKIETVFNTPIVFEVLGSGFEKPSNASFHMLRHPRVKKMHEDRTWKDAVSMQELKDQAAAAMEGPVSSESQETKRWLEKMEKRCVKKFERERTCTPKTRTATPSTRGVLTSPSRSSLLDGTTLVERPASPSPKRPREETSPTPCPPAKRSRSADARSRGTERSNALADITNRAPLPAMNRATSFPTPHTSKPQPVLLNSLSSKLRPCPQHATPTCQHPCPLESTTVLLAPCIAHTPYVALDLLVPHFANGQCAIRTSSLSHWQRDTGMHRPLSPTVSESPAYAGRKKIVLVEGKRRNACRELVENVCKALGKGERAEIWDWRVLEHLQRFQDSKEEENFLGALTWDEGMGSMSVSDGVEWLIESDRSR